jgi:hypothetical protein
MLGVLAFYFMILDSKLEKKSLSYLHTLVARFNKRSTYYLGKIINIYLTNRAYSFVPNYNAQKKLQNII